MTALDDLASPDYRAVLARAHEDGRFGRNGHQHATAILRFAESIGAGSLLDYGCGRGTLKAVCDVLGFPAAEFDPGVPGKDRMPGAADLLVSTAVLEHIEPDRLDAVLSHQRSLAHFGGYFAIGKKSSQRVLDDGRNAHLIVEDDTWWIARLKRAGWRTIKVRETRPKLLVATCLVS